MVRKCLNISSATFFHFIGNRFSSIWWRQHTTRCEKYGKTTVNICSGLLHFQSKLFRLPGTFPVFYRRFSCVIGINVDSESTAVVLVPPSVVGSCDHSAAKLTAPAAAAAEGGWWRMAPSLTRRRISRWRMYINRLSAYCRCCCCSRLYACG